MAVWGHRERSGRLCTWGERPRETQPCPHLHLGLAASRAGGGHGSSGSAYAWAVSPGLEVGFWGGFKPVIGSAGKPPGPPTPAHLERSACPDPGNATDGGAHRLGVSPALQPSGLPSLRPFPSLAGPSCWGPTLEPPPVPPTAQITATRWPSPGHTWQAELLPLTRVSSHLCHADTLWDSSLERTALCRQQEGP